MAGSSGSSGGRHTIATLFATRAEADRAADALREAGFSHGDITVVDQSSHTPSTTGAGTADQGGFWDSLKSLFSGADDVEGYYEGVNRGQALLTVHVDDAGEADRAADVLERFDPIDLDAQEATWRQEGWTGQAAAYAGQTTGSTQTAMAGRSTTATAAATTDRGDDVIRLAEERIAIGKRDVTRGSVRVRTFVVETPVSEDVHLREERVTIERRPVDRAVEGVGNAFEGRTIEVVERGEEAVVSKTARVTEELVVRKDVNERVEQVRETTRRTEVEIDDSRSTGKASVTGASATVAGAARTAIPTTQAAVDRATTNKTKT